MAGDGKMKCSIPNIKIEMPTTTMTDMPALRTR